MKFTKIHPDLPIFTLIHESRTMLYTPGHLISCTEDEGRQLMRGFKGSKARVDTHTVSLAQQAVKLSAEAVERWQEIVRAPFHPECLIIHLNSNCSLDCTYCYSRNKAAKTESRPVSPSLDAIEAAAVVVSRHCNEKGLPLQVVFHGDGEPTYDWPLMVAAHQKCRRIASSLTLDTRFSLITNGAVSEGQAFWITDNMDFVSISCDGPPEIQNLYRPHKDGSQTSGAVEQTCRILSQQDASFEVRSTILPQTMAQQSDIARYAAEVLQAGQLRFEPVFQPNPPLNDYKFAADQADEFVHHFLSAGKMAARKGIKLVFSHNRLDEIHGPHCDPLKQVLRLKPGDIISGCFHCTPITQVADHPLSLGYFNRDLEEIILEQKKILTLRHNLEHLPDNCQFCINGYHCARQCPELCTITDTPQARPGFHCRVNLLLTKAWLKEAIASKEESTETLSPNLFVELEKFPRSIDQDKIMEQYLSIPSTLSLDNHRLPLPLWKQRDFEFNSRQTWCHLKNIASAANKNQPVSIYLHVPFCDRRCGFCDCYSIPLSENNKEQENLFLRALQQEIELWSSIEAVKRRPVTTIHWGGGTPNILNRRSLERIVLACRKTFNFHRESEWALETSSSPLDSGHLRYLQDLGFTRLHLGVQTMSDPIRQALGRKETARKVTEKINLALSMGFIVSVDIIYGLPDQTIQTLVNTLESLIKLGVHGFSLYQLQPCRQNNHFFEKHGLNQRNPTHDYLLFQAAEQLLIHHQYTKNHFTHYALPPDRNLYYTHATRQEDRLALGPIADGVMGSFLFRNPQLNQYSSLLTQGKPAYEGGLFMDELEQKLQPVTTALMSGSISTALLEKIGGHQLLQKWLRHHLIEEKELRLTANGSYLINYMIEEVREHLQSGQMEARDG